MKVTRFYGRVNDQEFENVNDYNKAIVRAMNDGDLKSATSRTWVEEVLESPKSVPAEQLTNYNNNLKTIFEDFSKSTYVDREAKLEAFEKFKDDVYNHFNNVEDDLIENDLKFLQREINDLQHTLTPTKKNYNDSKTELQEVQQSLQRYNNDLVRVQRAIEDCQKVEKELITKIQAMKDNIGDWQDIYTFLEGLASDTQDWIDENLHKATCEKCGEKCEDCQCNNKPLSKPDWMSDNYFNLLKEIFG